jgi:hypothetical protein
LLAVVAVAQEILAVVAVLVGYFIQPQQLFLLILFTRLLLVLVALEDRKRLEVVMELRDQTLSLVL